jgi:membrane dipeptidase
MFTALARSGGVAGLNLCPAFLGEDPDLETCLRHIEHFLALGGEKAVCLGTDLDGIDRTPRGIAGVQDMGALYETLLRHGLPEELVRDIFYNNLMAYLERALE